MHAGHAHWRLPFDFSNVQLSAWFALIPATVYIWFNMKVLKMDHMAEYVYFKRENGLRSLRVLQLSSFFFFGGYLIVALANIGTIASSVSW